ncbi:MAG: NAD(P)H-binding protein [Gammaproteobacteria bacterium]
MLTATAATASDADAVLVFGGTGRLGAPIVRLLVEAGYPVTVFARPSSDRSRLAGLDVTYLTGDLTDADSVVEAVDGRPFGFVIDASARGASRDPFYATAMRNILAAVADSGVRQFILHGSVGAGDNMRRFPNRGFERMRAVMQAKGEAEASLRDSGIAYTIIRNGMVRPDGTPATGTARLTGDDTVLAAVTRADLAALTLQCLDNSDCLNRTFHAVDGD